MSLTKVSENIFYWIIGIFEAGLKGVFKRNNKVKKLAEQVC
jgi:hypothetical protein